MAGFDKIVSGIEPLEELEAPGLGSYLAGIGGGLAVGLITVGVGVAIT